MLSDVPKDNTSTLELGKARSIVIDNEKDSIEDQQLERVQTTGVNLVYDQTEEEPELHARTYFALLAVFFLNVVQVVALQGPPAVVSNGTITSFEQY
jgi:hypothetical protein